MLIKKAFAVLSAAIIGQAIASDATPVNDNPVGVVYKAALPDTRGKPKGSVAAIAPLNGRGVRFTVKFEDLPTEGGPFTYHIHVNPVPTSGSCTATLDHLDPFQRGANPPCDSSAPESCQVGDLSGKHGKVVTNPFYAQYIDYFASIKENDVAFFGDKSVVLHYANSTRLACANFKKVVSPTVPTHPPSNCSMSRGPAGTGGVPTSTGAPSPTVPVLGTGSKRDMSISLVASAAIMLAVGLV